MANVYGGPRRKGVDSLCSTERDQLLQQLLHDGYWALCAKLNAEALQRGEQLSAEELEDQAVRLVEDSDNGIQAYLPQFFEAYTRIADSDKREEIRWETIIELRRQRKLAKRARKRALKKSEPA